MCENLECDKDISSDSNWNGMDKWDRTLKLSFVVTTTSTTTTTTTK
jgi:hypothetical protein